MTRLWAGSHLPCPFKPIAQPHQQQQAHNSDDQKLVLLKAGFAIRLYGLNGISLRKKGQRKERETSEQEAFHRKLFRPKIMRVLIGRRSNIPISQSLNILALFVAKTIHYARYQFRLKALLQQIIHCLFFAHQVLFIFQ